MKIDRSYLPFTGFDGNHEDCKRSKTKNVNRKDDDHSTMAIASHNKNLGGYNLHVVKFGGLKNSYINRKIFTLTF
jgi:hypothetical protein